MAEHTRRSFLKETVVGAATIGALGALPAAARAAARPTDRPTQVARTSATESFVVHVHNPARGEMVVLVGTEEIKVTDHDLVARLVRARRAQ